MGVNVTQPDTGAFGLQSTSGSTAGFIPVNIPYNASSIDLVAFVADRPYRVMAISGRPEVIGSDGGAVTATVKKAGSTVLVASGTALHTGTYDLKGTAATVQNLTLATNGTVNIAAGDVIGVDFTGTLTAATGAITVLLAPR